MAFGSSEGFGIVVFREALVKMRDGEGFGCVAFALLFMHCKRLVNGLEGGSDNGFANLLGFLGSPCHDDVVRLLRAILTRSALGCALRHTASWRFST